MRIPLILACPGRLRGSHVLDGLVSAVDLAPTLLDLLGVEGASGLDGVSQLAGPVDPGRAVYMESAAPYLQNGWAPLYGLRRGRDKYILAPRPEYYDLSGDPGELENLDVSASGEVAAARDALAAELEARLERQPPLEHSARDGGLLDAEAARRLEALGYVGGSGPDEPPSLADPKDMLPVLERVNRSALLLQDGRVDEALAVAEEAAALSPRDRRVLQTLGLARLYSGDGSGAEQAFRAYLEIRPSADIASLLAQILIRDDRREEAHLLLDEAERLDPEHGVTYLARGDLLVREGRLDEAIEQYERARTTDPTLSSAVESSLAAISGR